MDLIVISSRQPRSATERQVAASRAHPGFGSPCNGCGQCCVIKPCRLARDYAGVREGPCPVLIREGDAWRCGLTIAPHRYVAGLHDKPFADEALAPMFAEMLGIGRGCDAEI